jgi:hypothetical protein
MRFRAKFGPWKVREYAVALNKTPQFVNTQVRAGKLEALITGTSVLLPHAVVAAGLGMSAENAEDAWEACCEEAERRAAQEAAQDKRNQPRGATGQAPAKRKAKAKPASRRVKLRGEVQPIPA